MKFLTRVRGGIANFFLRAAAVLDPRNADVRAVAPEPPAIQDEPEIPNAFGPVPSLFQSAALLEETIALAPDTPDWRRRVRHAVNRCLAALQAHVASIAGPDGLAADVWTREPRLLHAVEQLQADLAQAIAHAWATRDSAEAPAAETIEELRDLARHVRQVAEEEFSLLHESFRDVPASD